MTPPTRPTVPEVRSLGRASTQVTVGLAFLGMATYVFLTVGARAMGPARFAEFAVFWGLAYGLGLGLCLPLEQELARRVAAAGSDARLRQQVARAGNRLVGGLVVIVAIVVLGVMLIAFRAPLGTFLTIWGATVLAVAGLAVAYSSRGALAGANRFTAYSLQLGVEGAVRLLAAPVLALTALGSAAWPWMSTVALALLLGVLLTRSPSPRGSEPGDLSVRRLFWSLAPLAVCAVASQSLLNFGPAAVHLLAGPDDQELAGRFLAATLIARLPVFGFAAVQAVLIPHLSAAVAEHSSTAFRQTLYRCLAAALGLGAMGLTVAAVAGPQILSVFGEGYRLPRQDIVMLALGIALLLVTLVLQPAAVALKEHWPAAAGWGCAAVVFVLACSVPATPVLAVQIAIIASAATATLALSLVVARGLSRLPRAVR